VKPPDFSSLSGLQTTFFGSRLKKPYPFPTPKTHHL
jgi:hypothetical protein